TIAARIRMALDNDHTVAVISPDRSLTRRISAALSKWDIVPDDSAGVPLSQTPPGRLLREVANLMGQPITVPGLLSVLKHPLTHTGENRGDHLKNTRDYELKLRRYGPPFPDQTDLQTWASESPERIEWAGWMERVFAKCGAPTVQSLDDWVRQITDLANLISSGPSATPGTIWNKEAGRKCLLVLAAIADVSDVANDLTFADFAIILKRQLQSGQVTQQDTPNPNIKILGTLEARAQTADLVILAGLNEGIWPSAETPDPWMNRAMRQNAGLLNPDRKIGLAAHDYQIALSNSEVWITRSLRSSDAETVPSRWLNRFANLLNGLSDTDTHPAWDAMLARGQAWMAAADAINAPVETPKAKRPAPCPPVELRPKELPVTAITRLIRDPYAVYAQYVLGLYPLNPLLAEPDALLRGIVVHKILETSLSADIGQTVTDGVQRLLATADDVLAQQVPWPAERRRWMAMMTRNAEQIVAQDIARRAGVLTTHSEISGRALIPDLGFSLTAKADRIDILSDRVVIYDYKTGNLPTQTTQKSFEKQLLLEIELSKRGGFPGIDPNLPVSAAYIGVGSKLNTMHANADDTEDTWLGLIRLIGKFQKQNQGYASRRAMQLVNVAGRYDHLARYGEWDVTDTTVHEPVT
ncbi:MAG: double-strand break repair protein AddB, partial [Pseudomonadota bacterium]